MLSRLRNLDRSGRALIGLAFAVILFFAVNIFSNTVFKSMQVDLTQDQLFTLSEGTKRVLALLDEPVDIRLFFSRAMGERSPENARHHNRVRELLLQYAEIANGKIRLTFENPEPFSSSEDRAVAFGLEGIPVNEAGDQGFFGLAATNSTDDQVVIPFFSTERETFLEYDLTKMVQRLVNPTQKTVGLLSTIPISGGYVPEFGTTQRWPIVERVMEFFLIMPLPTDIREVPEDVDILMLVHPVGLNPHTLYAIDQFMLRGGKALAFLDPVAEAEAASSRKQGFRPRSSDFNQVLERWGLHMATGKVAADLDSARRVNVRQGAQMKVADYVAWLSLTESNFAAADVVTGDMSLLNVASAGVLEPTSSKDISVTPLVKSGTRSMRIEASKIRNGADVLALFRDFKSEDRELIVAARVTGKATSAFPDGPPRDKAALGPRAAAAGKAAAHLDRASNPFTAIVVADIDMLHQRFWLEVNETMGQRVMVPNANNGDFVVNALDYLTGSDALTGLRARGKSSRPFTLVQAIRRDAEQRFSDKEQQLRDKLTGAQERLNELMSREADKTDAILRTEQKRALDESRSEIVAIRTELRDVQHELRKDIESLEIWMKFFNIAAVPLLLGLATLLVTIVTRMRRRARVRATTLASESTAR
ncbi:MAG: ABC transporter [Alphaproteobacteria bacterium]|nr:ABC transporter [Alphaproteobacteria bacterium]